MARVIPDYWRDTATKKTIRAWELDPHSLDRMRREIAGLLPRSVRLTYGYRSDTRVSAELSMTGELQRGSWVRLTLDTEDANGKKYPRQELGTFVVSHSAHDDLMDITTLTLQSVIWSISEDRLGSRWTVGKGASAKKAIQRACKACHRQAVFLPSYRDRAYGKTVAFLPSEAAFSGFLFDACKVAGARMDVDGHGRLTFAGYVEPRRRAADWVLDERERRSIILAKGRTSEDNSGEAYNRTVVQHTKTSGKSEQYIFGSYNQPSTSPISGSARGFTRTKVHEESDLKPETTAQANRKARAYAGEDADRHIERKATVLWCDIAAGDIVDYINTKGKHEKRLVKTVEARLDSWTKELTMEVL